MGELLLILALITAWTSGFALARAQHHRHAMLFFGRLSEVARVRPITGHDIADAWERRGGQGGDDG